MVDTTVADTLDGFIESTDWLWLLSLGFFGVGDLVTTSVTVFSAVLGEGNPAVTTVIGSYGFGGFVALKLVVLGGGYAVWRALDTPLNVGVPLAFAVIGVGLTTWNLFIIGYTVSGVALS